MNRTFYFLAIFGLNILSGVVTKVTVDPSIAQPILLFLTASAIVVACFRWANMGYQPAWGLLTLIPFVGLYGLVMPPNAKTEGIDTAGKVVGALLSIIAIALAIAIIIPSI